MRILSLWISSYKNIEDLELNFNSEHGIALLVGQNGLGKSNLIEILSLIFRDLYFISSEAEFKVWPDKESHFEYSIEYLCRGNQILINCRDHDFEVYKLGEENDFDYVPIPFRDFLLGRRDFFLPTYVVVYYSGENKRIKKIIAEFEDIFIERLKRDYENIEIEEFSDEDEFSHVPTLGQKFRYLFFAENYHSQLLLLTLAFFQKSLTFGGRIKQLLSEYLRIEKIQDFSIRFKSPSTYPIDHDPKDYERTIDYLIPNISNRVPNPFWGLPDTVDGLLSLFYDHQAAKGISPTAYQEEESGQLDLFEGPVREYLEFNDIDFDKIHIGLDENNHHPLDIFEALETSNIIDVIDDISFSVKKKGIDSLIELTDLSEGEQQFLTVIGLLLVTGKDDSLYLLDEPDTHLNPNWQREYVDLLKNFNPNPDNSHIFVATHSPLIVQSSKNSDVVLFYEEEPGTIITEVSEIEFHRWRTDHVLTSKYFGFDSARPKDPVIEGFMARREAILRKDKISKEDEEFLRSHIDEGGLLPSGETYNDLVAMQFVRLAARRIKRK